ncbi:hypothetical protein RHSIM_RhsimUnG0147900 [Rhododendron simsii]|uniref:Uncharacterized protein n=1 Tax=Rhododendron simsii TaxID=118357 RepID=A0A834FXQ5_RHOSS|nr:hypothetical protein RHSIM_RhsimUnG0147900 [Rhododendron simsii]
MVPQQSACVGFAVREVLWMKQNKIRIGFLDLMGFLAAVLQILSSEKDEDYVRIPIESLKCAPREVEEWIFTWPMIQMLKKGQSNTFVCMPSSEFESSHYWENIIDKKEL